MVQSNLEGGQIIILHRAFPFPPENQSRPSLNQQRQAHKALSFCEPGWPLHSLSCLPPVLAIEPARHTFFREVVLDPIALLSSNTGATRRSPRKKYCLSRNPCHRVLLKLEERGPHHGHAALHVVDRHGLAVAGPLDGEHLPAGGGGADKQAGFPLVEPLLQDPETVRL